MSEVIVIAFITGAFSFGASLLANSNGDQAYYTIQAIVNGWNNPDFGVMYQLYFEYTKTTDTVQ